ncbi:unnamed protein product [Oppiella nova]|uniref:Homeobox domain-containing protein n=1 Tax=Oppiella nova TaxID=334625 RepID=A0A7R9LWD4_9ACAR|nr:unnamed protein product [Oppiella nova]CAG2167649.1 unnamed protein product [Oppiella nova]
MSVKMNCKESATKRCRTRFNLWQIRKLEKVFHETHYPDTQQMEVLASETSISMSKMQIWFQNRRAKWRKNSRLKNFGGLASVRETAYVPAPHMADTLGFATQIPVRLLFLICIWQALGSVWTGMYGRNGSVSGI